MAAVCARWVGARGQPPVCDDYQPTRGPTGESYLFARVCCEKWGGLHVSLRMTDNETF